MPKAINRYVRRDEWRVQALVHAPSALLAVPACDEG